MPSVAFWAGVTGGTEEYRCRIPGSSLERHGWDVRYIDDDQSDFSADVVVFQRVVHPHTADLIRALQRHGVTVVYDIDDWYDGVPDYNTYRADDHLAPLHDALAAADLITVSTPELADGYGRFGPVRVLPNYLDPEPWTEVPRFRQPRTDIHIGWMGHAEARGGDLDLFDPWVKEFFDSTPQARFVVAGSGPEVPRRFGVNGLVAQKNGHTYLRPYSHLPAMLAAFDIGLVPLTQNRFNQAKSWCKGMEYNAAGVPVVASPSREYRTFIQPGVNGLLVRRNDWPTAIRKVMANLSDFQAGARKVAAEHHIDRHIDKWVDAYETAALKAVA